MPGRFEGKTAFITGASSGIGAAVALQLAREGANVVLAARREDRLTGVAQQIEAAGGKALALTCDVCDRASIDAAVTKAVDHFGGLDIVVANAGFYVDGIVQELGPEDFRAQMETNFFGVVDTVYATLPHLRASKGRLGIVSSIMGLIAMPASSVYCASKYALCGFGEAAYYDLAAEGIALTMINPGLVESEIRSKDNRGRDTGKPDPAPKNMVMPAGKAARLIVNALYKRRAQLILTNAAKFADLLNRFAPAIARVAFRYGGRKKLRKRLNRLGQTQRG